MAVPPVLSVSDDKRVGLCASFQRHLQPVIVFPGLESANCGVAGAGLPGLPMQQITRDAAVVDLAQQGEPVADQKLARNRIAPGCLNSMRGSPRRPEDPVSEPPLGGLYLLLRGLLYPLDAILTKEQGGRVDLASMMPPPSSTVFSFGAFCPALKDSFSAVGDGFEILAGMGKHFRGWGKRRRFSPWLRVQCGCSRG